MAGFHTITAAIVGAGFIGPVHVEGLRRLGVRVKGIAGISPEEAERAAFKGDYAQARDLYSDALFDLGRDNVQNESRRHAADRINAEIERIRSLENK